MNTHFGDTLKWVIFILSVLGLGIFLAPVFTGIINIGNVVGMLFCGIIAVISLNWRIFRVFLESHVAARAVFSVILLICIISFICAVVISLFMIKAANTVPAVSGSTLIVLGCRVKGEQPGLMLQNRINAAYAYLSENPDADAILSGGQGSDELISEAECMYRELVDMGIAPERLVKEDKSSNTHENLQNSLALTENDNIVIVTSEFHQYRAKLIAQKEGTEVSAISAKTSLFLLPTYWVRDCLGCAYELVSK